MSQRQTNRITFLINCCINKTRGENKNLYLNRTKNMKKLNEYYITTYSYVIHRKNNCLKFKNYAIIYNNLWSPVAYKYFK